MLVRKHLLTIFVCRPVYYAFNVNHESTKARLNIYHHVIAIIYAFTHLTNVR